MSVSSRVHHNPSQRNTPHGRNQHYTGVNAFDAQVLRSRAIAPEVAAARGVHTQVNRMVIPWHTATPGKAGPEQGRPHNPTPGKDGKLAKYLFKRGAEMILDVHPYSQPFLAYLDVPIIITESALKADAIISALMAAGITRFCVLAINGVQGWSRGGKLLPCFDAMQLRGRVVYIVFDSDAFTNPNVTKARRKFTALLRSEHGADVHWIDTPTTPEGEKQGPDDALASGLHSITSLLASAYPAPEDDDDEVSEIVILRRRVAFWQERAMQAEKRALDAEARDSAKHDLLLNTHHAAVPRALLYNTIVEAEKVAGKRIDEPTQVTVSLAKICNDFRRKGQSGPYNDNGTKVITDRRRCKELLEAYIADGTINAEIQDRIRPDAKGKPYASYDVIIKLDDTAAALRTIAKWEPKQEKKTRGPNIVPQPCVHCGEVHSRTQRTTCNGCGQEVAEPKILPALMGPEDVGESLSANTSKDMGESFSPVTPEHVGGGKSFSSPSPLPRHSPAAQWLFNQLRGGMRPVVDVGNAATAVGFDRGAIREAREALGVEAIQVPRDSRLYLRLPTATHSGASERQAVAS